MKVMIQPRDTPTGVGIVQNSDGLHAVSGCCLGKISVRNVSAWLCRGCDVTYSQLLAIESHTMTLKEAGDSTIASTYWHHGEVEHFDVVRAARWVECWTGLSVTVEVAS